MDKTTRTTYTPAATSKPWIAFFNKVLHRLGVVSSGSPYDAATILRWLWRAWRGNRLQAVANALLGIASVGVSLGQVWAVQHAIDVAAGVVTGSIYRAVGLMGVLVLCGFAIDITAVWVRNILGIKAKNRMQQQLLDHILRSEWHGKERFHSGDVINRLETDVTNVVNFLTEVIPGTLSVLALFIGAFCYLFAMDRMLALITIAIIPVFVLLSRIYVGRMRRLNRAVRDYDSKVQSELQEMIQNRMMIKTLEGERPMVERIETTQGELRHRVVRRTAFSVFSNFILNFGFALGYLVAFLWAAVRMSQHTLTFGGMTAFLQLVNKIQSPARNLAKLVPAFVSVFTAAERLMELEENPMEEQGEPVMLQSPCGIRMRGVSYRYDNEESDVVSSLDYDFEPGTSTAILGETGVGKTTLIRIMLALLTPRSGTAEIYDEHRSVRLGPRTRYNFVYVPQGNTLMSGTIRDNLRLGKLDATDEEMYAALRQSCADFVAELPDGLDTMATESGGGLSEGQAQRVAIARALLRNRGIMLFDEATSALDPETEKKLLHNLLSAHDKTVIFITHRMAVVDYCDRMLRIGKPS